MAWEAGARRLGGVVRWAVVAIAFAAATAYLAWPLPRVLGTHVVDPVALGPVGVWGRADLDLLMWILAWGAHALATAPARVFQANILYPASNVLALSEHLIGLAPVAAPVFLITGNAVLTYNVTVLVTVLVTALTSFALTRSWAASAPAGFLAAAAFAFSPMNVFAWTRLHASAVHFFPLVLLLAWRAAAAPRPATLALLAATTALQLLAGIYVAFELAACLVAFAPALWWEARRCARSGVAIFAALAAGALALVPIAFPYLRARETGILRDYAEVGLRAEGIGRLAVRIGDALTWPVIGLALVGAVAGRSAPRHLRGGLLLVGFVGLLLCLGPDAPLVPGTDLPGLYALASRYVPGFSGIRGPVRFIVLPLFALAVLAGIGAGALAAALARRGPRAAMAAQALVLTGALLLVWTRAPARALPVTAVNLREPRMAAYPWLAAHGGGRPVLELPIFVSPLEAGLLTATGRYMVGSTLHWSPLVNGYTGHPPPSYTLLATLANRLPDAEAFDTLCSLIDLGWLVVHLNDLGPQRRLVWDGVERRLALERAWSEGDGIIYRVAGRCGALEPELRRQLSQPDAGLAGRTLGGVSRSPLPASAQRATVDGPLPAEAVSGMYGWFWLKIKNESGVTWPGLSVWRTGRVALQARWRDAASGAVVLESEPAPLAEDLGPNAALMAQVGSTIPRPGTYDLEIGVLQEGIGWFVESEDGGGVLRQRIRTRGWEEVAPRH